jgi:hypothetical protein
MTDAAFAEFEQRLQMLAEHVTAALTPKRILSYFAALEDLALDEVRGGIEYLMRHWRRSTILPSTGEIREAARGDLDTLALLAWERFRAALHHVGPDSPVAFDDPATHAVIESLGGWRAVSMWAWLDVEQLGYHKLDFMKLWKHYTLHPPAVPPPTVLNDDLGLQNPVRRMDARGLPEPMPALPAGGERPKALQAGERMIDLRAEWPSLAATLPEALRPGRARPERSADEMREQPPDELEAHERKKRAALLRFREVGRRLGFEFEPESEEKVRQLRRRAPRATKDGAA